MGDTFGDGSTPLGRPPLAIDGANAGGSRVGIRCTTVGREFGVVLCLVCATGFVEVLGFELGDGGDFLFVGAEPIVDNGGASPADALLVALGPGFEGVCDEALEVLGDISVDQALVLCLALQTPERDQKRSALVPPKSSARLAGQWGIGERVGVLVLSLDSMSDKRDDFIVFLDALADS